MNAIVLSDRRWSLSSGTVEALKWFAFLAMVVDHVDVIFFGRGESWMVAIGRFAMPVFAVVFGYNLARSRDPYAVAKRLLVVGLAVQPIAFLTINCGGVLPLNILLTFAAGAGVYLLMLKREWLYAATVVLASSLLVDYAWIGVCLVAVSALQARSPSSLWFGVLGGLAIALCGFNGNGWALGGFALVLGAGWVSVSFPRSRWALLAAYPGHLMVLGVVAWVWRSYGGA